MKINTATKVAIIIAFIGCFLITHYYHRPGAAGYLVFAGLIAASPLLSKIKPAYRWMGIVVPVLTMAIVNFYLNS